MAQPIVPRDFDPTSTDPAVWEALLRTEGYMGEAEEKAGLESDSGGLIVSLMETIDGEIARRLEGAGDRQKFMGSPNSFPQLFHHIAEIVHLIQVDSQNGPVQFVLRRSCTTADDTLVVYISKGIQYHWNTRNISNYSRRNLARHIASRYYAELQILDHNNYGQLS